MKYKTKFRLLYLYVSLQSVTCVYLYIKWKSSEQLTSQILYDIDQYITNGSISYK